MQPSLPKRASPLLSKEEAINANQTHTRGPKWGASQNSQNLRLVLQGPIGKVSYPKRRKAAVPATALEQSTKNRAKRSKIVESLIKNKQNTDQKPDQKSMENQPKIKPKSIKHQSKIHPKIDPKFDQNGKMSRTSSWEPSWRPLGGVLGAS